MEEVEEVHTRTADILGPAGPRERNPDQTGACGDFFIFLTSGSTETVVTLSSTFTNTKAAGCIFKGAADMRRDFYHHDNQNRRRRRVSS